jgi:hypothetical protein
MLKVALIAAFMATFVAPWVGMVDTTEGTVTVSCPHPTIITTMRDARKVESPKLSLRIGILFFNTSGSFSSTQMVH